jgi:hypothetical protein
LWQTVTDPWTLGGVSRSLELNTPSKVLDMWILITKIDPIEAQGDGLDLGDTLEVREEVPESQTGYLSNHFGPL